MHISEALKSARDKTIRSGIVLSQAFFTCLASRTLEPSGLYEGISTNEAVHVEHGKTDANQRSERRTFFILAFRWHDARWGRWRRRGLEQASRFVLSICAPLQRFSVATCELSFTCTFPT